jgi:hypothetical protein
VASLLWTQRQDIGPSARFGHALAYDASGKRTVLVGGDGLGTFFRDTWLWDGEAWTQVEDIGPSGRAGHATAFDSARSRVVLFGGRSGGALSDTWVWDGDAWTQVEDTGPSARNRHALAYDSARSRVVLFGGQAQDGGLLGDTWEWDGDAWTQVADAGPPARGGHAMCFDAVAARTVLFGGSEESDTWAWDGTDWTALNDVGPAPCRGTALVFTGQSSILFGGIEPTPAPVTLFRQTWELEGSDWTERQDMGPTARYGHAMAYDQERGRVVLFGGSSAPSATATADDLWSDTWETPGVEGGPGEGPVARLVSFKVAPDVAGPGETVTFLAGLDRPARAQTLVSLGWNDLPGVMQITIDSGQTLGVITRNADVFDAGPNALSATLGADTLRAAFTKRAN